MEIIILVESLNILNVPGNEKFQQIQHFDTTFFRLITFHFFLLYSSFLYISKIKLSCPIFICLYHKFTQWQHNNINL